MKLAWIYFQVPYANDATQMRALLGFRDQSKITVEATAGLRDIPTGIVEAEKMLTARGAKFEPDTVFIYAHDERHGLAWPVKEQADKLGCQFSRQVPEGMYPDVSDVLLFCAFDNGRPRKDPSEAQQEVLDLNSEAKEEFSYGDMLPVMTKLRSALDTSLTYFGWTHPLTAFTIRNLLYAFQATGNSDNIREGDYVGRKFAYEFKQNTPKAEVWSGSEMFFDHIADVLATNGYGASGEEVRKLSSLFAGDRR